MDLHYLRLFNTLAAELSYSKTASMLYISQPAVSMQIKKLENDLGMKLFYKVGKNLYLNENGRILYDYTRKIFSLVDEAEARLSSINGDIQGVINICASNTPGTYILPRVLGEFKELYPAVIANLHVSNTYEIEKMILDNKIDFAINGGDISYSRTIVVERLAYDEAVFVASPGSRFISGEYIQAEEIANLRYIAHEDSSQLYKLLESIVHDLGLPFNVAMTLGSIDAIKQAVSADLGVSVIPRSAISLELKFNILKEFKIQDKPWLYPYNLIYHKNKFLSPAAKKLIELIREKMKGV